MLAPNKYTATVGQPNAGSGAEPGQGMAQQNSYTNALRGELRRTAQQTIEYDPQYNNMYEDVTLQQLEEARGANSKETTNYYRDHASRYGIAFLEEAKISRMGRFHSRFFQILNNYGRMGNENSQAKQEFAQFILKRIDFSNNIMTNASFWFSRLMMEIIKKGQASGNMTVNPNEMFNALDISVINILNIEIVAWLHGFSKAKHYLYNQTPDIIQLLSKFQQKKEIASAIWAVFDEQSPYDRMDFSNKGENTVSGSQVFPELVAFGMPQVIDSPESQYHGDQELYEIPLRMAQASRHQPVDYNAKPPINDGYAKTYYGPNGSYREDLENIKPDNAQMFNVKSYFRKTCLSNWFTIDEGNWKYIKHVLKRNPSQRSEETLFNGCVRLVQYDFDNENSFVGWTSRSIRFKDVDKEMILSDPTKLIPLLEDEIIEEGTEKVSVLDAKAFFNRDKDEENMRNVDDAFAQLREAYYNYHVITDTDEMESSNSKEIIERMIISANVYSKDTDRPVALMGSFNIKDRYMVSNRDKRDLIARKLPILFAGNSLLEERSYFNAIEDIKRILAGTIFDDQDDPAEDRFETYLRNRLTNDINNWLVHSCGYVPREIPGPHLDVGDIIEDVQDLKGWLLKNDKVIYDKLNRVGESLVVTQQLCLFDAIKDLPDGADPITAKEYDMTLDRSKNYHYITICNERGPGLTNNEPIVVRRSNKPEMFLLLDELDKVLNKKDKMLTDTNIIIRFDMGGSLFLVSSSVYDPNVVTLRSIIPRRTLLNPLYG